MSRLDCSSVTLKMFDAVAGSRFVEAVILAECCPPTDAQVYCKTGVSDCVGKSVKKLQQFRHGSQAGARVSPFRQCHRRPP